MRFNLKHFLKRLQTNYCGGTSFLVFIFIYFSLFTTRREIRKIREIRKNRKIRVKYQKNKNYPDITKSRYSTSHTSVIFVMYLKNVNLVETEEKIIKLMKSLTICLAID